MKLFLKRTVLSFILISVLCGNLVYLNSCSGGGRDGEYTYRTYTTALASNWNPHTWQTNADSSVLDYILSPLVDVSVLDSENGIYQWVYEMAESVTDVTEQHRADLKKYGSSLPDGVKYEDISEGFVFEIKLNPNAKWENGDGIEAQDYVASMKELLNPKMKNYRANLYISGESALAGADKYYSGEISDFDSVGLYEVDNLTVRYVTKTKIDINYFLSSLSSNWLVHVDTYNRGKVTSGELVSTDYNTSLSNTVSAGPYKLASLQEEKQMTLVRNENWYGWETEDGELVSYTNFLVDGERIKQYQTTRIVIDVMDESSAKSAFIKGELTEWTPSAEELVSYSFSDRLYRVDETYTMSLFFNTNTAALEKMDKTRGNKNSLVLSNYKFRKAFSLAINRAKFCTATGGSKPQYALINGIYYYDIYNDPQSIYRETTEAMQAVCNLYGIEWGEETDYPTLERAYSAVTGYNLTQARSLMKAAFSELSASGKYKKGEEIKISVAWSKGALTADDNKQITLLNSFLNEAAYGSGFGKITLVGVGNIANRYSAVPSGDYAIGYGAWGGAAFYPFRNMQVYMDPDKYSIHEAGCYDPKREYVTLNVNGKSVTKTWQAWSNSMVGSGEYSSADMQTKLSILAALEGEFLSTYYRIPLCSTTLCSILSYQVEQYSEEYNIMYGFGGLRLMKYNYDDEAWEKFVRKFGGKLEYE